MNLKPFISREIDFNQELFEHKFTSSFLKLIELKGCYLRYISAKCSKDFISSLQKSNNYHIEIPLSIDNKILGCIILSKHFSHYLIEQSLGGNESSESEIHEITQMSLSVLNNFAGAFSLSIREGVKASLGLDIQINLLNPIFFEPTLSSFQSDPLFIEKFELQSKYSKFELVICLVSHFFKKKKN